MGEQLNGPCAYGGQVIGRNGLSGFLKWRGFKFMNTKLSIIIEAMKEILVVLML